MDPDGGQRTACPPKREARRRVIRVLGLGNDLLADDAFGIVAARELERRLPEPVEVVCSPAAGLALLDALAGSSRLLVLDTWQSGAAPPGTVYQADEGRIASAPGPSPHCLGLRDALALGRRLHLPMPTEVAVVAVEPADCLTVGGPMSPAVARAIPTAVEIASRIVRGWLVSAGAVTASGAG